MVISYDPSKGYIKTALSWIGTILPYVIGRFEFWCFMGLHILISVLYRTGRLPDAGNPESLLFISWNHMKIISGITTFFEVFFTNQTFGRYMMLYDRSRVLIKMVGKFCFEVSLHLRESQEYVRVATRYFLASAVLFFREMEASDRKSVDWRNSDDSNSDWKELEDLKLIRPDEREYLETKYEGDHRSLVMLHWAAKVISMGNKLNHNNNAPANALKNMVDLLVDTHKVQQEMIDCLRLPIPFQYYHLLNLMIVINLVLWAYGMGISESMFAPVAYFFAALIFMGMMELATQLTNPFGDDDTDFPLKRWVIEVMENAVMLVESTYPGERDKFVSIERLDHKVDFQHVQDLLCEISNHDNYGPERAHEIKESLKNMGVKRLHEIGIMALAGLENHDRYEEEYSGRAG